MSEKVRITIEFELPHGHSLAECEGLVLNQMKAPPEWEERAGTGLLNYVCYDRTLRVVAASIGETA